MIFLFFSRAALPEFILAEKLRKARRTIQADERNFKIRFEGEFRLE